MKYVGIDLGMTYSKIAVLGDYEGAWPRVLEVKGLQSTPSVVWFPVGKPAVVGNIAKRHMGTDAKSTVAFAKREMVLNGSGEFKKKWNINGTEYTPVDISGIILKQLYDAFLETTKEDHKVVVTCPSNYNLVQRDLVREAAKAAGIDVSDGKFWVVNEPTAAALSYVMETDAVSGNIIVFDLGGGSLNLTSLHYDKSDSIPKIFVVDSVGLPKTGGADWDEVVKKEILHQIRDSGAEITPEMEAKALYEAEIAKINLTYDDLELYYLTFGDVEIEFFYTQDEFELDTKHLLEQVLDMLQQVIDEFDPLRQRFEGVGPDIDEIILVGGSCNMPQIKKGIEARFPQFADRITVKDPGQAIARGATYYCKIMGDGSAVGEDTPPATDGSSLTIDPTQTTIGTDVLDASGQEMCFNLFYMGDPLPCRKGYDFYMGGASQNVSLKIYANDDRNPGADESPNGHLCPISKCRLLGAFKLELPIPVVRGDLVKMFIEIDAGGVMTCSAECNGWAGEAKFVPSSEKERSSNSMTESEDLAWKRSSKPPAEAGANPLHRFHSLSEVCGSPSTPESLVIIFRCPLSEIGILEQMDEDVERGG